MGWDLVVFLATLQGVAEFLPISSSGHLRVAESALGFAHVPVLFDVLLHLGTLVAVVVVYRPLLVKTLVAVGRGLARPRAAYHDDPYFRLGAFVALAMVPTLAIVLLLRTFADTWALDIARVGATLLVTAGMLVVLGRRLLARRRGVVPQGRPLSEMTWRDALVIGSAQGLSATFRGLSRSGSTITGAVFSGLDQEAAASFSFLVSIPAVLGALVFSLRDYDGNGDVLVLGLVGAVVAGVVGWLALRWLLALLGRGRLHLFAGWCAAVGVFAIVWRFTRGA